MDLSHLQQKKDIKLDNDRLGGRTLLETNVYATKINVAYLSESKQGATGLNIELQVGQQKVTQQIWMSSGTKKGKKNTYTDKDGNDQYLPGFMVGNSLALLGTGKPFAEQTVEMKTLNLYDYEAKKEIPTEVPVLTELTGVEIKAAIEKQLVDKKVKTDAGAYVPNGETREQNEVVKFFRDRDGMTVTEIQAEAEEAVFLDRWVEKNKGNLIKKLENPDAVQGAPVKDGAKKTSMFA